MANARGCLIMRVTANSLTLRAGPGLHFEELGTAYKDEAFPILDVGGWDCWVKTERGWLIVQNARGRYMEKVEQTGEEHAERI